MDSIIATKSKKKNKLFPCFRAATSSGSVRTMRCKDASDEVLPFMMVDDNMRPLYGDNGDFGHRKKKGGTGALSRAFKAVLFGTSLAKKIKKRKAKEKQSLKENQRLQDPSSISNNRTRIASDLNYNNSSTCSSRTSAPFSSSLVCSSSPSSSEMSEISFRFYSTASNQRLRQINFRKIFNGWFVLLVCLLSLVLWGKIGAIICTSVWILCLYRRRVRFRSPDDKANPGAMSSSEYYMKGIIVDGFLKRDRSGARQNSILHIN